MARIPENQAVFFELDGVVLQQPRLTVEGEIPFLPTPSQLSRQSVPWRMMLYMRTSLSTTMRLNSLITVLLTNTSRVMISSFL